MKIKIIDLFVKIANGEKVPNKIKFRHSIWEYRKDGSTQDYINDYDKCLMEFLAINKDGLNQYVEIIDEPKKIEKLPYYSLEKIQKSENKDEWYENRLELLEKRINDYHNKINKLIDEINNLKEND